MTGAAGAAERAARESFGKLVAFIAARSRDVALAEDALADALLAALERWPVAGTPANPEAWLLTVARRRLLDRHRHRRVVDGAAETLRLAQEEAQARADAPSGFPDERLRLLFACVHPAIDPAARTPLMLNVVLGLDAARIAGAFLASPAAMTKRLTRAKARLREAGAAFDVADPHGDPAATACVLAAIHAAYTLGWDDAAGLDRPRVGLTEEAIWLGRVLSALLPGDAKAMGLLALMLFCEARQGARLDASGGYVPLGRQDVALWSAEMTGEAEALLRAAGRLRRPGRYQLQAAIQAVHAARRLSGATDWSAVTHLYDGLIALAPTVGAAVGRAASLCEGSDPARALAALEALPPGLCETYQPYWATRGHVLSRLGQHGPAAASFARAIGLTEDAAVRRYLLGRSAAPADPCDVSAADHGGQQRRGPLVRRA